MDLQVDVWPLLENNEQGELFGLLRDTSATSPGSRTIRETAIQYAGVAW